MEYLLSVAKRTRDRRDSGIAGLRDYETTRLRDHETARPRESSEKHRRSQPFSGVLSRARQCAVEGNCPLLATYHTAQKKTFQQSWKAFLCPG